MFSKIEALLRKYVALESNLEYHTSAMVYRPVGIELSSASDDNVGYRVTLLCNLIFFSVSANHFFRQYLSTELRVQQNSHQKKDSNSIHVRRSKKPYKGLVQQTPCGRPCKVVPLKFSRREEDSFAIRFLPYCRFIICCI